MRKAETILKEELINKNPTYVDTTSSTTIYEGYKYKDSYLICKIDLSDPVIHRTYAVGAWDNRASLSYE